MSQQTLLDLLKPYVFLWHKWHRPSKWANEEVSSMLDISFCSNPEKKTYCICRMTFLLFWYLKSPFLVQLGRRGRPLYLEQLPLFARKKSKAFPQHSMLYRLIQTVVSSELYSKPWWELSRYTMKGLPLVNNLRKQKLFLNPFDADE